MRAACSARPREPAARQAAIQSEIADAFRSAFITIAAFTAIGAWLAWSLPLRRV